ncbi:unnamed protein product [Phaeothamnion confervicola]
MVGIVSKDDYGIGSVVISIAFTCMYLFWMMAWMHQWHPLIVPEYP